MSGKIVRDVSRSVVQQMNQLLYRADKPVLVDLLNSEGLDWCIALARNERPDRQLPWCRMGHMLRDKNAFNFCFKLRSQVQRIAGACMCEYCPTDQVLNVEMVQRFRITTSVLEGNLFRFVLYTVVLFLLEIGGKGVRIMFPVNRRISYYYIEKFDFYDITDDLSGDILYRDTNDLIAWFMQDAALIEGD